MPGELTYRQAAGIATEVRSMGGELLPALRRAQFISSWAVAKLTETEDGRWSYNVESRHCRRGKGGVSMATGIAETPEEALAVIRAAIEACRPAGVGNG